MDQVSLRDLVQQYTRGEIDREEYLKNRTELIDNVLSRDHSLRTNSYPPPIKPSDESTLDITERSQKKEAGTPGTAPASAPAAARSSTGGKRLLTPITIATALILVIIVLIAVVLLLPDHPTDEQALVQSQSAAPEPAAAAPRVSDQARTLIEDFLQKNTWGDDSLDTFLQNWKALPEMDQQSIKGSMVLNRLTNAIYERLLEERAIAGLDSSAGDAAADVHRQEGLVAFARGVGIDDARIRVQVPTSAVTEQTMTEADTTRASESGTADQNDVPAPPATEPAAVVTGADQVKQGSTSSPVPQQAPQTTPAASAVTATASPAATAPVAVTEPTPAPVAAPKKPPQSPAAPTQTSTPAVPTTAAVAPEQGNSGNCNASLLRTRRPYCRDVIPGVGNGPTMVIIPSGRFAMGGERSDEQPVHNVVISKPFAMSVHEITYGEYQQYCKDTKKTCPAQPWAGDDYPVVNVSWGDAVAYTRWLSTKTGQDYRLPSESQWEYAARGGTTTVYPFGDTIDISYAVFSERKTLSSPLPKTDRTVNRNKFRLYHIVGNVREWVQDTWVDNYKGAPDDGSARMDGDGNTRIARGGSYSDNAEALRSAARKPLPATTRDSYTGFRVIQVLSR